MNRPPAPSRRLDWVLFGLRWLLIFSAMTALAVLPSGNGTAGLTQAELIAGAVAVAYNLLLGALIFLDVSDRVLRPLALAGDVLLPLAFFWVSAGSALVLVGTSLFVVITASLRYGRVIGLLTTAIVGALGLALSAVILQGSQVIPLTMGLLFLFLATLLTSLLSALRADDAIPRPASRSELAIEADRLRATRERARAISEMASTLGATLNYAKVLDAALDVGVLGLRDINTNNSQNLIGAVLLFQSKELRVATSRRFARQDDYVRVPGERGILGLATRQAEPVFGGDAHHDPELQYFSSLAEARSILAIPLRAGYERYGVLLYGSNQPNAFSDEHVELLTAIGTQATISLQNAALYQNLRQEKEKIVEVEEDARKKLARDLHDGPTQSVAAIAMRVNYIRTLLERRPEEAGDELYKVEELARRTTKEIRHMLFTLRPLVLETQGLSAAFVQLAEKMKETHDLNVIVEAQPGIDNLLETHAQGVLFYIVEEAVNNARKHAQAEHHWVRLFRRQDNVIVEVQDDGLGFDLKAVTDGYDKRGSLGMINMRERAELAEGSLQMYSAKGEGTRITVTVPIKPDLLAQASTLSEMPAQPLAPQPARAKREKNKGSNGAEPLRSPSK